MESRLVERRSVRRVFSGPGLPRALALPLTSRLLVIAAFVLTVPLAFELSRAPITALGAALGVAALAS